MNTLPRKPSKVGKVRRKSKKLQRPSNTNSSSSNQEGDGGSELVSNCVTPSEVSLSSQISQHRLRPHQQTPFQPPLPRKTKLSTTRRNTNNSNGSGCGNTNSAGSNASNRFTSTKRANKRSTSRVVAPARRSARNSYEDEDERLISTEPSLLPPNPPPLSERGSSECAELGEQTQSESNFISNNNNNNTNNSSCINTFISNNSVIRHEENKKPANMTQTLFPPTILPSTVNNRCKFNMSNRYNNNNNSSNNITNNNNNNNNSNMNHLRSLGRSSYLSSNAKNTVNRVYGVGNFNSGLVSETKSCSNNNTSNNNNMMDKYATNLTRHGKGEDWIMINNPAAQRETASEQTIHLERTPFHHTRAQINNERFSLPPSSRKYGSGNLNNNLSGGISSVRRISNKNLKTLSASRPRGRCDSEPTENVRGTDNNDNNENVTSSNFINDKISTNSNSNNNDDEDQDWKRDKLLRGSYVINEDYRRSERDNAQMINFLRERASALNKSRLALEGNNPITCQTIPNHSEECCDSVNGEVLSPKPPKSPPHALCKENVYTRTIIAPNEANIKTRKASNQENSDINSHSSQPTLTATPPLPPHSSPAGSLLTSESPNTSSLTPKAQRKRRNVQGKAELTCQLNTLLTSPESKHTNGGINSNALQSRTQGEEPEQETVSTPTMFTSKSSAKNEPFDRNSITNTTVNISLFNRRHQMQLASEKRQNLLNEASQSQAQTNPTSSSSSTTTNNNNNKPSASPYDFGVVLSSGKSGSLPIVLTVGYGSTQGMRPTMEDEHFIQLNAITARGGGSVSMLGILDGHCGRRVAAMSAKWLPKYFFAHSALGDNNALALVEAIVQVDRALYHALSIKQGNHTITNLNSNNNSNKNSNVENDKESYNSHIDALIHRSITSLSSSNDPLNETHHGTEDEFDRPINVRASINNGYNSNNNNLKNGSSTSTTINSKDKKSDANHNFLHGVDLELDSFDFDQDEDSGRWDGVGSGGSTLITAAVHGRMLYVACLGDARAVLYDGKTTIAMSEDHKPHNTKESNRITRCGGFVQFGRVCGVLAVSRALGDFEFKFPASDVNTSSSTSLSAPFYSSFITTSYLPPQITSNVTGNSNKNDNSTSTSSSSSSSSPAAAAQAPSAGVTTQNNKSSAENNINSNNGANSNAVSSKFSLYRELMVSNVADVKQLSLSDESKFLLLACDGLWDVISNEEATQFVKDFLTYTPDINDPLVAKGMKPYPSAVTVQKALNNCCTKLAEFAVDRGSSDNVTVMLLFFHDVVQVVTSFSKPMSLSSPSSGAVTPSPSGSASNGNIRNKLSVSVSDTFRKAE